MPRPPKRSEARRSGSEEMEVAASIKSAADPEEVAKREQPEARPLLPKFKPLSAFEQSGKKLEFRRVSSNAS